MRILVCSFANPGFLFPLVGLALELRRRGHEVSFASAPSAVQTLGPLGLRRIPREDADGESFNVRQWWQPISALIDIKHIRYAARSVRPDLLLTHHLCLSALVEGERAGIPVAVLGPLAYLFPFPEPLGAFDSDESIRRRQWRLREETQTLNEVRRACSLASKSPDANQPPLLGDLFMLRTLPPLEPFLKLLPRQVQVVGPCSWEPEMVLGPEAAPKTWRDLRCTLKLQDSPVVYVHNGRTFGGPSYWPQLVEALGDGPYQVLAAIGRMDAETGTLPPNFYVRSHLPQGCILRNANAVVAGGHTTVALGAMVSGVPSILIPYGVDTPDNAERMLFAGCAIVLQMGGLTASHIYEAVQGVLADHPLRERCMALSHAFQAADSFEHAARLVESLGSGGRFARDAAEHPYVSSPTAPSGVDGGAPAQR